MRKNYFAKAAALLFLSGALSASAANVFSPYPGQSNAVPFQQRLKNHSRELKNTFLPKAVDNDGIMTPDVVHTVPYLRTNGTAGVIWGPNGEDWFYTLELDGDKLVENEYYTKWDYKTFTVKVYDSKLNFVGQASGEMTRPEGTGLCQGVEIGSRVTTRFFNSNSTDYEITITSNFNPAVGYGAKQTTEAYSLTEEIPSGGSKCLFQQPGVIVSTVNASTTTTENYVMALGDETTWDGENRDLVTYTIYQKAGWGTPASEVTHFTVDIKLAYSDGANEALPFVMTAKGSDVYVATALYEETFLDDPTSETPGQTVGNNYVITLYKASRDEDYTEIAKTYIPCEGPEGSDYLYRSYALGNFMGAADITFDFGDGDTPCYIISVVDTGVQDDSSAYYAVYDINGNEIARFGNGSDSFVWFSDIPGHGTQFGFNMYNDEGDYGTVLVDYPSLETVGMVPMIFEYDGEIYNVTSVPSRTSAKGGVYYVASVVPSGETASATAANIAWFTPDGELDHMDKLSFGNGAAKVIFNLDGSVLNPYLFNTNDNYEYMAWVYRYKTSGTGTDLELVVCDANGSAIATRKLTGTRTQEFCYVANTSTDPMIMITYGNLLDGGGYETRNEFIRLPLNNFEGEGTAESPYLIKSYGDLDQMRNNLTSHFRLANDIDCEGLKFRPIEGEFTGSLDGNGYAIRNLTISSENTGAAFFSTFGHKNSWDEEAPAEPTAVLKNVTFSDMVLEYTGSALGTKSLAFIANNAYNSLMSGVYVVNPKFSLEGMNVNFGVLACNVTNFTAEACAVKGADINVPRATGIGGLVYNATNGKFKACFVEGSFTGLANIGGIAAKLGMYQDPSTIVDCHINANLSGGDYVGGVVGTMNRSSIARVLVEGSVSADDDYVGGIAGQLDAPDIETPEADDYRAIDNCVVAIDELGYPEGATHAHRIVGYTAADDEVTVIWVPNPDNPEDGHYETIPASPETKIGTNYVISGIAPVESGDLVSEGTTVAGDEADFIWFEENGYQFGNTVDAPWYTNYMSLPKLYFESGIGVVFRFASEEIAGVIGEIAHAVLLIEGVDISDGALQLTSSDENVAYFNGYMDWNDDHTELDVQVECVAEGTATLTFAHQTVAATINVTVTETSGIANVEVESSLTYVGGTLAAEGCAIEVYDIQGRLVAAGNDTLSTSSLATGIYIARAIDASGKDLKLKISVK